MPIRIANNITALNARRRLAENSADFTTRVERLSSGLRINRGADDAAGLEEQRVGQRAAARVRARLDHRRVAAGERPDVPRQLPRHAVRGGEEVRAVAVAVGRTRGS